MSQTLAFIHTSPTLIPAFSSLAASILPDANIFHMVDESLIRDTIQAGHLRKITIRRLIAMVDSARNAGADAVLVTCSSIGKGVVIAQELFDFPVVRVDDAMAETAVQQARRIGVIATLETTLQPTLQLLRDKAAAAGKEVEIRDCLCEGAFKAVLSGDTATHDRVVSAALTEEMKRSDLIVLAQASMARVVATLPAESVTVPILSSPELAVLRVREVLKSTKSGTAV